MAKRKRFEHRVVRPTLAASLESLRQGQSVAATAPAPPEDEVSPDTSPPAPGHRLVAQELTMITLIMAFLVTLLVALSVWEIRTGTLTSLANRLLDGN
jgi:hypothetical protein